MRDGALSVGILCHATFGGSGVVATELGLGLAERGHRVHVFAARRPPRLTDLGGGVTFHEVRAPGSALLPEGPYALALASKVATLAATQPLEVIHTHYAIPHAASARLAQDMLGPKSPAILNTLHGSDVQGFGLDPAYLPVTRHCILAGDGITVPSQFLRSALLQGFQLPPSTPIEVIPNFVDTWRFAPREPRDRQRLAALLPQGRQLEGAGVLIHNSNFREVKRVQDVVSIFARVQAEIPAVLLLVGEGPERGRAEAQVAALGLAASVAFLGEQQEVAGLLQLGDLFLLPSEAESFGVAALEALSCGLPVIASDVGGLPELIAAGETGFLHPVGDIQGMAQSCLRLLRDAPLRQRFSREARRRVEQSWRREPLVQRYEDAYRRILIRRSR